MAITSTCTSVALLRTTADRLDAALAYCVIWDQGVDLLTRAYAISVIVNARNDLADCGKAILERWGITPEWDSCLYMMHEIDMRLPDRD